MSEIPKDWEKEITNKPPIEINLASFDRLYQGDIISNITYIPNIIESQDAITYKKLNFPYVIVLSQDCDIKWHSKTNLLSIIVAPLYNIYDFVNGEHLTELNILGSRKWESISEFKLLINNDLYRYHFLKFKKEIEIVESIIDYKHYFSLDIIELINLKKQNCKYQIAMPYREQITQRFSNYLSRIGLPERKEEKND